MNTCRLQIPETAKLWAELDAQVKAKKMTHEDALHLLELCTNAINASYFSGQAAGKNAVYREIEENKRMENAMRQQRPLLIPTFMSIR